MFYTAVGQQNYFSNFSTASPKIYHPESNTFLIASSIPVGVDYLFFVSLKI